MDPDPAGQRVLIFDTTLRDGEQSAGATLSGDQKLEIAGALARLGVDVIEAGFPASSQGDWAAVERIAREVGAGEPRSGAPAPVIAGLARLTQGDIDRTWAAVQAAKRPRLHVFIGTSPIHMEHKLRMAPDEVLDRIRTMVRYARGLCADVEFSAEDASRSEPEFLEVALREAIAAGATTLNVPDTVGYAIPDEFAALVRRLQEHVVGLRDCVLSVHCHDDLGLATANTLAALRAGARQAEVTVNGIGERAGNTSLEEVVMAIETRRGALGLCTTIDTTLLVPTSLLVSQATGMVVQPNKAVVGANAFAHESGIHQDGVLKHRATYEIMRPEGVGALGSRIVLGKLSGRHALEARLGQLGFDLHGPALDEAFGRFKEVADRKKNLTDADLEALVVDRATSRGAVYSLESLQVASGTAGIPMAAVRIARPDGRVSSSVGMGTTPIEAVLNAINQAAQVEARPEGISVQALGPGAGDAAEVCVRVRPRGDGAGASHVGRSRDGDYLVACARAYLEALSRTAQSDSARTAPKTNLPEPPHRRAAPAQ